MSDQSARFGLPFILPGQAQKELFHNEALALVDAAMHPAVEEAPIGAPPVAPAEGQCWIVASDPSSVWGGRAGQLAIWTSGGWRYVIPQPGMAVWEKSAANWMHWTGTAWDSATPAASIKIGGVQVVGARTPEVPTPSGGSIIDVEARSAIAAIIATFKSHGLTE